MILQVINFIGIFTIVFCAIVAGGLAIAWAMGLFDWRG
jgi:hypothetical protein